MRKIRRYLCEKVRYKPKRIFTSEETVHRVFVPFDFPVCGWDNLSFGGNLPFMEFHVILK